MRELTASETELVVGGNTIGRRIWFSFKSFAKFYWSERESVAERAKKNWGIKKKISSRDRSGSDRRRSGTRSDMNSPGDQSSRDKPGGR